VTHPSERLGRLCSECLVNATKVLIDDTLASSAGESCHIYPGWLAFVPDAWSLLPPSRRNLTLGRHGLRRDAPDLLDEKLSLINELFVIGPVFQELRQEGQQLVPIHDEDLLHRNRLVGVGDEDLEDMKALVLHHLAVVSEQVHANLQMLSAVDVLGHDVVVGSVEEDLAQELDGLPLGDVAVGLDQYVVVLVEEQLEVDV